MKNAIFTSFLFASFFLFSAMTSINSPIIGTWEYTLENTPEGNFSGQMVITKEGNDYKGMIVNNGAEAEMKDLKIEDNRISFNTYTQGYSTSTSGFFEEGIFKGTVTVDGYEFPITAKKVEE